MKGFFTLGLLSVAFFAGILISRFLPDPTTAGRRPAPIVTASPRSVRSLGRLEPDSGIRHVAPFAGLRVKEILVTEGQSVAVGTPLAILEGNEERKLELAILDAQINEARERLGIEEQFEKLLLEESHFELGKTKELAVGELAFLEINADLAEKAYAVAQAQLERIQVLQGSALTPEQIDRQRIQVNQLEREMKLAKQSHEKAKISNGYQPKVGELADKKVQVQGMRAKLAIPLRSLLLQRQLADIRLSNTIVAAPIAGTVLRIMIRPGESSTGQPILQLGDTSRMVAVAEVYETDVGRVRIGQPAKIRILSNQATGKVSSVGLMVSKNSLRPTDPMARTDARIVEVRVPLDDPAPARRLSNLQVEVEIDTSNVIDGTDRTDEESNSSVDSKVRTRDASISQSIGP